MFGKPIHLVRVAKRLVRYNTKGDGAIPASSQSESAAKTAYRKRMQYSCEKCGQVFQAWKYLHKHKVDRHSY